MTVYALVVLFLFYTQQAMPKGAILWATQQRVDKGEHLHHVKKTSWKIILWIERFITVQCMTFGHLHDSQQNAEKFSSHAVVKSSSFSWLNFCGVLLKALQSKILYHTFFLFSSCKDHLVVVLLKLVEFQGWNVYYLPKAQLLSTVFWKNI